MQFASLRDKNAGHVRSHIGDVSIGFGERLHEMVLCSAVVLDEIRQFFVLLHLRGEQTLDRSSASRMSHARHWTLLLTR